MRSTIMRPTGRPAAQRPAALCREQAGPLVANTRTPCSGSSALILQIAGPAGLRWLWVFRWLQMQVMQMRIPHHLHSLLPLSLHFLLLLFAVDFLYLPHKYPVAHIFNHYDHNMQLKEKQDPICIVLAPFFYFQADHSPNR